MVEEAGAARHSAILHQVRQSFFIMIIIVTIITLAWCDNDGVIRMMV
jgi:hypothetical protein